MEKKARAKLGPGPPNTAVVLSQLLGLLDCCLRMEMETQGTQLMQQSGRLCGASRPQGPVDLKNC